MSEEIDVRALELPKYAANEPSDPGKVSLRIREFPGDAPVAVRVNPDWTVDDVERKFARAGQKNPQSVRLTVNGQPLPKNTKIANLSPQVLSGEQILDAVPEHPVGRSLPTGPPDLNRIRAELTDLPYKRGYGTHFKASVESIHQEALLRPCLHIRFQGQEYKYQLDLTGYPNTVHGRFVGALPPCPIHGGKHPHVFQNGTFCWMIEADWSPSMTLARDYILFIFRTLNSPREHVGCRTQ
jgi:hypothetical protein